MRDRKRLRKQIAVARLDRISALRKEHEITDVFFVSDAVRNPKSPLYNEAYKYLRSHYRANNFEYTSVLPKFVRNNAPTDPKVFLRVEVDTCQVP